MLFPFSSNFQFHGTITISRLDLQIRIICQDLDTFNVHMALDKGVIHRIT